MIDPMLSGKYNWLDLSHAYIGDHFVPATVFCHFLCAKFLEWNARSELFLGVILSLIRALLFYFIFCGFSFRKARYILLGGILALVFSSSQACIYLYGEASIPIGLCSLGYVIGLFAIVRIEQPWLRRMVALLGGLLSCYSWGNFLPCWATFFVALFLFKRPKTDYIFWLLGALMSITPYAYSFSRRSQGLAHLVPSCAFNTWFRFINMLGRPLCNKVGQIFEPIDTSFTAGLIALLLYSIASTSLIWYKKFDSKIKASLVLALYGFLSIWLISIVRIQIAPWYTAISINFWIALLALIDSLLVFPQSHESNIGSFASKYTMPILGSISLLIISIFYCLTNITYEDKHFYLTSRAPVSEATVRNFRTAPTYCETFVFQWGDGNPTYLSKLAEPLERHLISTFSNRQQWALQGDFPLQSVTLKKKNDGPQTLWLESTDLKSASNWRSYKHLNLCLSSHDKITWTIRLPENLKSATFQTALAIPDELKSLEEFTVPTNLKIEIDDKQDKAGKIEKLLSVEQTVEIKSGWQPISIPLSSFRGKELTITMSATNMAIRDTYGLFQYPHIDVESDKSINTASITEKLPYYANDHDFGNRRGSLSTAEREKRQTLEPGIAPSNTDLSPYMVKQTINDYCFPAMNLNFWHENIARGEEVGADGIGYEYIKTKFGSLESPDNLQLALKQYSHFEITMRTNIEAGKKRSLHVIFFLKDGELTDFSIPLLVDNNFHTYTFDFRLLDLANGVKLNKIGMSPASKSNSTDSIEVKCVRLIHK